MDIKIERVLISVSDKSSLEVLAGALTEFGAEFISTGGTSKTLRDKGFEVKDVSDHTGFPEMMDGRVKTLHPHIHAGILADRSDKEHMDQMRSAGIPKIDMVVVNLYPFEKTISSESVTFEEAIENIDIGGPSMLRAAAKNSKYVAAVSSPGQYDRIVAELKEKKGRLSEETLLRLAAEVFSLTGHYDGTISEYLMSLSKNTPKKEADPLEKREDELPLSISLELKKTIDLRYGENPHQRGAFYSCSEKMNTWIKNDALLQGKELSFNNILDLDSALEIIADADLPASVVIKHNNPSGAAIADSPERAFIDALDCDRMSAFGGIIGINRMIDGSLAERIIKEAGFFECLIAPDYDEEALSILGEKKNLRVVKYASAVMSGFSDSVDMKKVQGGFLVQDKDIVGTGRDDLRTVTKKVPSKEEINSLLFAWKVVRSVKSNAIVLVSGTATVGIGAGQMSRVDSVDVAISKAGSRACGAVMASDAFFPKPDSIQKAGEAGITAIIQPGGSVKDPEVIDACDKCGISMVFTGMRHFRH